MNTIFALISIIGMLTVFVGTSLCVTEIFCLYNLKNHLFNLGLKIYSAKKKIRNNFSKDDIGKRVQLIDAQVIFSSEYQCIFASRLSSGSFFRHIRQIPLKGEIKWSGENAKMNARIPLGFILILIGYIAVFGTIPFILSFGLSSMSSFDITFVIPFVILFSISVLYFYLAKKNTLRIISSIIELTQPKNM